MVGECQVADQLDEMHCLGEKLSTVTGESDFFNFSRYTIDLLSVKSININYNNKKT